MPTVADVLRRHGGAYLERFGAAMPAEHKKVLAALCACRTAALGTVIYECVSCGRLHAMHRSCGNRHCPTCQQGKAKAWLEKQTAQLLPCPYFLLTFTLPAALRDFVRSHQRACYAALFAASSEAIKQLAADPKHLGSEAISDRRIVSFDDQNVTFSYRKSGSNRWRTMTLEVMEFIRRFLQHVLPRGFQKVRHYGFLSPNSRPQIEAVRWLVTLANGQLFVLLCQPQQTPICVPRMSCAECGGLMRLIEMLLPATVCAFDTS
jgi:hypothetical protein